MATLKRINEEDFIQRLAFTLDALGFQTDVIDEGEYPMSIESEMIGYEDTGVRLLFMFLQMNEAIGDEVQMMQVYLSLWEDDIEPEKIPQLKALCNDCNMDTLIGTFGVQEDLGMLCYKQALPLRGTSDTAANLKTVMDTVILMAFNLDKHYDKFTAFLG